MHFSHHLSYRNKLEHFLVDMFEGTAASGPEVCVFAFFELPSYDNPCLEAVLSGNNAWISLVCPIWCVCEVSSSTQLLRSNLVFFVTTLHGSVYSTCIFFAKSSNRTWIGIFRCHHPIWNSSPLSPLKKNIITFIYLWLLKLQLQKEFNFWFLTNTC